jgi:hypothetical protein
MAALLLGISALLAWLTEPPSPLLFLKRLVVILLLLLSLIGFGAVAGKTLGDFLRQVNG